MPVRLFRDINMAVNIITAYREREQNQNWAEWALKNKDRAELLERAMLEAKHG